MRNLNLKNLGLFFVPRDCLCEAMSAFDMFGVCESSSKSEHQDESARNNYPLCLSGWPSDQDQLESSLPTRETLFNVV